MLSKALHRLAYAATKDLAWTVLSRVDALTAVTDPPAERASGNDLAAARLLAAADRPAEAIARLDAALERLGPTDLADLRIDALLRRSRLRLRAGEPALAEADARRVLTENADGYGWAAGRELARALRAQGRDREAAEVLAAQDIDPADLDDDEDDDY